MQRKTIMAIVAVAAVCMFGTPAFSAKGKPNFGPAIDRNVPDTTQTATFALG